MFYNFNILILKIKKNYFNIFLIKKFRKQNRMSTEKLDFFSEKKVRCTKYLCLSKNPIKI